LRSRSANSQLILKLAHWPVIGAVPSRHVRMSMVRRVLLLGRLGVVVEDAQEQVRMPDVQLLVATGLDEVRSAFAQADIDHVIMGAGLDLEARLEIVREIFLASDKTTIHLKDFASGPDGFLPFVRSVLAGLADYQF
jgi:hypothetical protein